jgi:hypothetical protein
MTLYAHLLCAYTNTLNTHILLNNRVQIFITDAFECKYTCCTLIIDTKFEYIFIFLLDIR